MVSNQVNMPGNIRQYNYGSKIQNTHSICIFVIPQKEPSINSVMTLCLKRSETNESSPWKTSPLTIRTRFLSNSLSNSSQTYYRFTDCVFQLNIILKYTKQTQTCAYILSCQQTQLITRARGCRDHSRPYESVSNMEYCDVYLK
jgi:hypothetical protein